MNIVLVDGDAPWVRALFEAMPPDVAVHAFRPRGPVATARRPFDLLRRWHQTGPRWWERSLLAPSWSKAPRLTAEICGFHLRRRLDALADDVAVIFTLPYYAPLAEQFRRVPRAYFAFDPYKCYTGWNANVVAEGEHQLLSHCDATFAISRTLADDFRTATEKPVFVQPNAVSRAFLSAFEKPLPPPADLPLDGAPLIGCIGQISKAYDWALLVDLIRACSGMVFVFIGPIFGEGPGVQAEINHVLSMPNVRWLGPKPHAELPSYINRFDVCLNPLRVEPCNDRRSLLRLYDYLASDRPVVSTAVASAQDHEPFVEIGRTSEDLAASLRRNIGRGCAPNLASRRAYIRAQTWERRAETFMTNLRTAIGRRPA